MITNNLMQGLTRKNKKNSGTYLNIKSGKIVKNSKDENGKRFIKPEDYYDDLTGYVRSLNLVDKELSPTNKYQEIQIVVDVPLDEEKYQRYTLTHDFSKAFSTGFLLSLANADLTRQLTISVYSKKPLDPTLKPSTFCALKYAGERESIKWIGNVPEVEFTKLPNGETHKSTKARRDFLMETFETIKEKLNDMEIDEDDNFIIDSDDNDDDLGESL